MSHTLPTTPSSPKLSIIIVTWNSAADIDACLDSINFEQEFELLVVDNASSDETLQKLKARHHLLLITNERNLGYARANNQALGRARGEYVLLLNPDTRIELGALGLLAAWLDSHPDTAAVAPCLLNPDGTYQPSVRSLPTPGTILAELTGLARLFPHSRLGRWRLSKFDYTQPAEVEQPMASCLMLRRAVLQELGGFDESFPIFYNDVDLCKRLLSAGWKIWYVPAARVIHRRGASTSQVRTKMIWETHRSLFRYLAKHDSSRCFWLKAIFLLPLLELTALCRVLWYHISTRTKPHPPA